MTNDDSLYNSNVKTTYSNEVSIEGVYYIVFWLTYYLCIAWYTVRPSVHCKSYIKGCAPYHYPFIINPCRSVCISFTMTGVQPATVNADNACILFSEDKHRFFHFTNSHQVYAKPTPARIIIPENLSILSPYTRFFGNYAIIISLDQIPDALRNLLQFEKFISTVILKIEIDMFTSSIRDERFHTIKSWCHERSINFGCYLYQTCDNLQVPAPSYHSSRVTAFQFHILDTECDNKYASIMDMIQYLLFLGISSRTIVPLYIPHAPYPIQQYNAMGYFFRQDLCEGYISRKRHITTRDLAFTP